MERASHNPGIGSGGATRMTTRILTIVIAVAALLALIPLGRMLQVRAAYADAAISSSDRWTNHCGIDTTADAAFAVDRTRTVMVNGEANPLLCTFRNPSAALEQLNRTADLSASRHHCVVPLTPLTWQCYAAWSKGVGAQDDPQVAAFFDIYENGADNDRIVTELTAMQRRSVDGRLTDNQLSELAMLFPDYAPINRYVRTYADDTAASATVR